MAEEIGKNNRAYDQQVTENVTETGEGMASTDRGLFDFMKKKEDEKKAQATEEVIATEFGDKVQVSETAEVYGTKEEEEKKHHGVGGLVEKLHRSDSSSSSSDEEGDDEEKKKKKKKKEKKGGKDKHKDKEEDTNVPIEKYSEEAEKKAGQHGILDKIKEKLPGGQNKKATCDEHVVAPAPPVVQETEPCTTEGESKEKKGFLDKIKEKIPGFHSKHGEHEEKKEEIKRETE